MRFATLSTLLAGMLTLACQPTNEGYAPDQPIAYSHAVHAGAMQVPCLYCHAGAEKSRHAGVPSAGICMNCHTHVIPDHPEIQKVVQAIEANEPIRWVKVHKIPDHVFFDHSVHVNAKVDCQRCHGPIESMGRVEQWSSLTMGWCLDCHRDQPANQVVAQASDFWVEPRTESTLTDCSTCHH